MLIDLGQGGSSCAGHNEPTMRSSAWQGDIFVKKERKKHYFLAAY